MKRRLFNSRWSPNELYNRYFSWLPLVWLIGLICLALVAVRMSRGEPSQPSNCVFSAGKCYPYNGGKQ